MEDTSSQFEFCKPKYMSIFYSNFLSDWRGCCAKNLKNLRNCENGLRMIVLNWGLMACIDYICLVAYVCKAIGIIIGQIFIKLYNWNNMFLAKLIAIGHSCGARIVSAACQFVRDNLPTNSPNGKVGQLVRKFEK